MEKYNIHSASGIAEDMIRCLMHLIAIEMHLKTDIEKLDSEIQIELQPELIERLKQTKESCHEVASLRREDMLKLYELFGSIGDKSYWCLVKHSLFVAISAFEVWQATDEARDYESFICKQKVLNVYLAQFLGVEVTDCASCFSDILKAEEVHRNGKV